MKYSPTENDLRMLLQSNHLYQIKIEVLNKRFQTLADIQGEVIDMNCNINSDSDIRRSCSLTVHVKDSSYLIDNDTFFWLDKYIRCWWGLYDFVHKEYVYYPLGIYLLNDNSFSYDANKQQLQLSMIDLMALATEARGNAIGADETVIEVNSNIRNAMISTLSQLVGWERYRICDFPSGQTEVPYDLEFSRGIYPYEMLTKLRDLYPCYQMYFDVDGTFVCDVIPSCMDDPVVLDHNIMDRIIIDESKSVSFSKVKNVTEIWGQELEADREADSCAFNTDTYTLTIADLEVMDDGVSYGFTADADCVAGSKVQINSLTAYPIVVVKDKADGTSVEQPIEAGVIKEGFPYVVYYTENKFRFYGELNVHGIAMAVNALPSADEQAAYQESMDCRNIRYVVNPEDKFAVERLGIIRQVFTGGEYENIYTSELALERAAYENWKSTRLQDSITLNAMLVPWLDVDQLIEYTSPITGKIEKAIVTSISFSGDNGTMSLGLTKFYPYYPW